MRGTPETAHTRAEKAGVPFRPVLVETLRNLERLPADEALRRGCAALARGVEQLMRARGPVDAVSLELALRVVLAEGATALLVARRGRVDEAARWLEAACMPARSGKTGARMRIPVLPVAPASEEDLELMDIYRWCAEEVLTDRKGEARVRSALREIRHLLRLSYDDLGRVLGTSGETVRRWATGSGRPPADKAALVEQVREQVARLIRLFRPDRLAQVIRRPAEVFGGRRALDLILEGRIAEVVDTYEFLLTYQPE